MDTAFAAWLMLAATAAGPAAAPREMLRSAVARVIAVAQSAPTERDAQTARDEALAADAAMSRRPEIRHLLGQLFDLDEIARRVLPTAWEAHSPAERAELTELVTGLVARAYVARVAAGEGVRVFGEKVDGQLATVKSKLVRPRAVDAAVDYRLHWKQGRWRVYDLVVDGKSLVATYRGQLEQSGRSSYRAIVEQLQKMHAERVLTRSS